MIAIRSATIRILKLLSLLTPRRPITIEKALSAYLSRRHYRDLLASCSDRRVIVLRAAELLGVSEARLTSAISHRFGFQFVQQVPAIDLHLLPPGITGSDCRRSGCIPIFQYGTMVGVIAFDPYVAKKLLPEVTNIVMSCWSSIARALDESERALVQQRPLCEKKHSKSQMAAQHSILLMIAEAERLGAKRLGILIEATTVRYRFQTADGAKASGEVHQRIKEPLNELLLQYYEEGGVEMVNDSDGTISLIVDKGCDEHGALLFDLSWSNCAEQQGKKEIFVYPEHSDLKDVRKESVAVQEPGESAQDIFSLRFPDKVIPFPNIPVDTQHIAEHEGGSPRSYHLLLVDDNAVFARVLERFFSKQGMTSHHVSSGKRALEILKELTPQPDLVVCDVHMPEMNGFEFVKRLRGELGVDELPVLMLTSDDSVETELRLLEDGADNFVSKSEDPRLLAVKIRRLLERTVKRVAA